MHTIKPILWIMALALLITLHAPAAQARAYVYVGNGAVMGDPYYRPYAPYYAYPYRHYGYRYYSYPTPPYPYGYPVAPAPMPMPAPAPSYSPPPPTSADSYYHNDDGTYCREYTRDVVVAGKRQQAYGRACRQPDGQWHIID